MKKLNLKKIALMSLAGGVLLTQSKAHAAPQQYSNNSRGNQYYTADASDTSMDNQGNMIQNQGKMMTEKDLLSKLNAQGKATYMGLDQEGKDLALKLANQSCKGQNECKGMNSCKTTENACAGLGGCQGTSKGPFTDKNVAVKVAAMRMAEKRAKMMNGDNQ